MADEVGFVHRIAFVAGDDARDAAAGGADDGDAAGHSYQGCDPDRDRSPCAMGDALQQESLDREDAERQDDQDQQRQAPRIDPEKQAAQGVVAVGLDLNVIAEQLADREADQHRQQFDAAKGSHDRGGNCEWPHVGRQQNFTHDTHMPFIAAI